MEKNNERKPSGTQVVNKAIKIKYIHFFPFDFFYKAQYILSAKRWKLTFSQLVKQTSGRKLLKKSMTLWQIHPTNFRLESSPFLCGWLYQLMGTAG